jgi:hypothetical protein
MSVDLACDESERRRIRSLGLHILAEASRGGEADEAALQDLAARLTEERVALHESGAIESNEAREMLQELRDVDALRKALA